MRRRRRGVKLVSKAKQRQKSQDFEKIAHKVGIDAVEVNKMGSTDEKNFQLRLLIFVLSVSNEWNEERSEEVFKIRMKQMKSLVGCKTSLKFSF